MAQLPSVSFRTVVRRALMVAFACASVVAYANEFPKDHEPQISVSVAPKSSVKLGQIVRLAIQAKAKPEDQITISSVDLAPYEVLRKKSRVDNSQKKTKVFHFELELLATELGEHPIKPLVLRTVTPQGQSTTSSTAEIPYAVRSIVGNEPNAKPGPPSKPVQVWEDDYTLLWVLGALLAMVLIVALTLFVRRWLSQRVKPVVPGPPPRPPWEIALEALHTLRAEKNRYLAEGRSIEWADRISDLLRMYLGARYDFDGLESTTEEVLQHLQQAQRLGIAVSEVATVLHECDLIKFAKATLQDSDYEPLLDRAVQLVERTQPRAATVSAVRTEVSA